MTPLDTTGNSFISRVAALGEAGYRACIGLDTDWHLIPTHLRQMESWRDVIEVNEGVIAATAPYAAAYKANTAFYEEHGAEGFTALKNAIHQVRTYAPNAVLILDGKRGDIGSTSAAYARSAFDTFGADAITVNPYLGPEAAEPFLKYADKGIFVVVKTSNPGGGAYQDLLVSDGRGGAEPLYCHIARSVAGVWNANGNCGVVAGATYAHELRGIRERIGPMPMLVPGVGAQGGSVRAVIAHAGPNVLINSSRAIMFPWGKDAEDAPPSFDGWLERTTAEAKKLHEEIDAEVAIAARRSPFDVL